MRTLLRRCTSLLLPLYCAVVAVIAANEAVVLATPSTSASATSSKASSSGSSEMESGADATLRILVITATIAFAVLHALAACALLWLHTRTAHTAHATLRSVVYAVLLSCALMHILCVVGFGAVHHLEQRMPLLSARLDRVLLPSQQGSCRAASQHTAAAHTTLASLSSTYDNGSGSSSSNNNKDAQQQEEDSMTAAAGSDGVLAAAQYMSSTPPSHTSSLTMHDYYDALHVALKTAWQVLLVLFDPLPSSSARSATDGGSAVVYDAMRSSRLLRRPLWLLSVCGFVLVVVAAAAVATSVEDEDNTNGEPSARARARNSAMAARASTTTATNATMADTEADGRRASAPPSTRTTQTLTTDGQRNGKKVQ